MDDEAPSKEPSKEEAKGAALATDKRLDTARMWTESARVGYIGLHFGIATAIGYFFGRWLDQQFDTAPALAITFSLFGIASSILELYRIVRRYQKENS